MFSLVRHAVLVETDGVATAHRRPALYYIVLTKQSS